MDEINTETANGLANDIGSTNLGAINAIYFVEDSSTQVKREMQDLAEEDSFRCSSSLQNVLNPKGKIKEIQDSDDGPINIKEEPMTENEGNAMGSILESVEIKKEQQDDIGPCHKKIKEENSYLKARDYLSTRGDGYAASLCTTLITGADRRDESPPLRIRGRRPMVWCASEYGPELDLNLIADAAPGSEKNDRTIKHGVENPILQSGELYSRLAHELLPPAETIRVTSAASSSDEKHNQILNSFIGEQNASSMTSKNVSTSATIPDTSKEGPFRCSTCLKEFNYKSSLSRHLLIHTGEKRFSCDICQKSFAVKAHLKKHMQTHTGEKPYKCPTCPKKFSDSSNLKAHKQRHHTGEEPYKCSVCSKGFSFTSALKSHERVHTGEKPFQCSMCDMRFSHDASRRAHERTHTGEKPFKCSVCSKEFITHCLLKQHQRIHTGEKPFKCSVCLKGFIDFSGRKRHERTHTGEKPYECSVCLKKFRVRGSLKNHELIHTGDRPFKCSVCPKRCSSSSNLRTHERIHTGEKPYKCSVCPKEFNQSSSLRSHERIHTGEKPFKCSVCSKEFNQSSSLRSHERTHL